MLSHLMLLPSLACPASCSYCFGPREGGPRMGQETLAAVIRWQQCGGDEDGPLQITFHGGEPLLAGADFYQAALPRLRDELAPREVRFGLQSNLWLLTDRLCRLFQEYGVSLGTSLDGPQAINDAQRGAGYFRRTMAGIRRARTYGLAVGCICTFTSDSAPHVAQVFDFFLDEGLDFSVHAALPTLGQPTNGDALPPETYRQLLVDLLDRYLDNCDRIRISSLDAMCRSIGAQRGGTCTFGDCLGAYLAVDPQGWIYPCQRFAGKPRYRLGNVADCPTMDDLATVPFWRVLREREARIEEACGECAYFDICRGGCPYNVLAANGGHLDGAVRDPHCTAYRALFEAIGERALAELFGEENMAAVVEKGPDRHGLLQKGKLLAIMRGGPHPRQTAGRAREVVAAVALAASASPDEALQKLDRAGLITRPERALESLTALQRRLDAQPEEGLRNAYVHITYRCNLHCSHCYARSGPETSPLMAVDDLLCLVRQAAHAGFRKAVITGGEPLMHPQRDLLLDRLAGLREQVKPLQTVLRTNLGYPLRAALLERLARSTDQVVVSIDGDETSHDARRGAGTYACTVANLRALLAANPRANVGVTAVLSAEQVAGPEGDAVRTMAHELALPVRFKPMLPLGRAKKPGLVPASYSLLGDDAERLALGARVAATCGLGMNLYVGPDGACRPCYALMHERHQLGNALDEGLATVLARNDAYRHFTVDSNRKCRHCPLRYLCGGFCRAWSRSDDPDDPPVDCRALYRRAHELLLCALATLNTSSERWVAEGLPLADGPTDLA